MIYACNVTVITSMYTPESKLNKGTHGKVFMYRSTRKRTLGNYVITASIRHHCFYTSSLLQYVITASIRHHCFNPVKHSVCLLWYIR